MKRSLTLLTSASLLLFPVLMSGQITRPESNTNINAETTAVTVTEDSLPMSKGRFHAYSITLPGAILDDAESILKTAFKEYKAKANGNTKTELFFDDATIKALSENAVDIYVRMFQASRDVKVDVFFDLGGIFLNPKTHPQQSKLAEQILLDYAVRYKRFQVETELKDQEKILGEREKELESLIKDKDNMEKSIQNSEREIEKSRQEIASNEMDQQRKSAEIATQKDVIVKISSAAGDEKKLAEKTLKSLEKELKGLQADEDKLYSSTQDEEGEIKENRRNIETNLADQETKRREIEKQKLIVSEVQTRLALIPEFK